MKKNRSPEQIEASRRNGQKSTGPKTPAGLAKSKMNALKHGILSKEVVVQGSCIRESGREFVELHQRLREDLQPAGLLEEMLVDQIATTHWRLRRVLKAESAEIALNVDEGHESRRRYKPRLTHWITAIQGDPYFEMLESTFGCSFLQRALLKVRDSVEKEGELTDAAIQAVAFHGDPFFLTNELTRLRVLWRQNPDGLSESALRADQKERMLSYINRELDMLEHCHAICARREEMEEEARQAAAVLPSPEKLDKIMRYETMLQRQLHRDMLQLERLQRRRLGEAVPPPLTMEVADRN
jgi:hypothetical protein